MKILSLTSLVVMGTLLHLGTACATLNGAAQPSGSQSSTAPSTVAQSPKSTRQAKPFTAKTPNAKSPLGINLSSVEDWNSELPFVDVFKMARMPWFSQKEGASWNQGGELKLTTAGYPAKLEPGHYAETVMLDNGGRYPAGQYTVLYDGDGKIRFGMQGVEIASEAPGRLTINVTPKDHGIFLQIRETNPANPIRNIRVLLPGHEKTYMTQPFNPTFLKRLAQFRVIRFMDWGRTNNSDQVEWSQRPTPQGITQTGPGGVAIEHMIQLANQLKADPWFTIPHQASDDYMRQFAKLVRERLDPSLKVYVEYSNEVWNYGFAQTRYAEQKGKELKLSDDRFQGALRYYSQRSVDLFKIWQEVFGGSDRIVEVVASQAVNAWTGDQILGWKDAAKYVDAYAIAPYIFGERFNDPAKASQTANVKPDEIVNALFDEVRTETRKMITDNIKLTKSYGVELVAYEGGPHLVSYTMPDAQKDQITALFTAVNRHARMRDLYRDYLTQWKSLGGGVFNQYHSVGGCSQYGCWGALEYQDQDISTAPKYMGLMDFIQANPMPR